MNPPAYDDVLAAGNRVLDVFAEAFEKWWLRRDETTREKYLATAVQQSDVFSEKDAERVRHLTRDCIPICHLLDVIGDSWDIAPEDPGTLRRYRNSLTHRNKTTSGQFVFLLPHEVDEFLAAAGRMVKAMRSKREQGKIDELATFVRTRMANGSAPAAAVSEKPVPPKPAPVQFPMPKVATGKKKPLDPDDPNLEVALSADQKAALDQIETWFREPGSKRHFALAGAAGSGKTTVTGLLIRRLKLTSQQVMLLAPTGKAVEALKFRLPRGWKSRARTLASFLWNWKFSGYQGENNKFVNGGAKPVEASLSLLIVDEASMVTQRDFEALSHYRRVLFTGDPDQLPPVVEDSSLEAQMGSCGVLEKPDATLQSVHRHGKDTAIYVVSHGARRGEQPAFGPSEDGRVLHLSEADGHFGIDQLHEYVDQADVVLTQRNSVRVMINEYVRRRRGFMTSPIDFRPKPGEILVCSENFMHPVKKTRVANGERMKVTEFLGTRSVRKDAPEVQDFAVMAHPEGREHDEAEWLISSQMLMGDQIRGSVLETEHVSGPRSGVMRADWGYCLTVHKAQGSEWPRVVVVDDNDPDHNVPLNKWYYVAYSRAVEQLVILKIARETAMFAFPG